MKIGIEIEFNMTNEDLAEFMTDLYLEDIDYEFYDELKAHYRHTSVSELVIKPERSISGWEVNIPPNMIGRLEAILGLLNKHNPTFHEKAALHIHVDTYYLSRFNIDCLHNYYFAHQDEIIKFAEEHDLYLDLNAPVLENMKDEKRKTRLNIRHAMAKHKTVEHRIYKATTDYNKVLIAISQTLNIIKEGVNENENN